MARETDADSWKDNIKMGTSYLWDEFVNHIYMVQITFQRRVRVNTVMSLFVP
jgi:hypothetical protein